MTNDMHALESTKQWKRRISITSSDSEDLAEGLESDSAISTTRKRPKMNEQSEGSQLPHSLSIVQRDPRLRYQAGRFTHNASYLLSREDDHHAEGFTCGERDSAVNSRRSDGLGVVLSEVSDTGADCKPSSVVTSTQIVPQKRIAIVFGLAANGLRSKRDFCDINAEPALTLISLMSQLQNSRAVGDLLVDGNKPHMIATKVDPPDMQWLHSDNACQSFQHAVVRDADSTWTIWLGSTASISAEQFDGLVKIAAAAGKMGVSDQMDWQNTPIPSPSRLCDSATVEVEAIQPLTKTLPDKDFNDMSFTPTLSRDVDSSRPLMHEIADRQATADVDSRDNGFTNQRPVHVADLTGPVDMHAEQPADTTSQAFDCEHLHSQTSVTHDMSRNLAAAEAPTRVVSDSAKPSVDIIDLTADESGDQSRSSEQPEGHSGTSGDDAEERQAAPSLSDLVAAEEDLKDDEDEAGLEQRKLERERYLLHMTRELSECSQLTPDNITQYCRFTGQDFATWDPQRISNSLALKEIKEYQRFTIWWMISEVEGSQGILTEDGYCPVGGFLSHVPGLGKTTCMLGVIILGAILDRMRANIEGKRDGSRHLAEDAAPGTPCPAHANQFPRYGFRCICEPESRNLWRAARPGANVITADRTVVRVWDQEIKERVDLKEYFRLVGLNLQVLVAHNESAPKLPRELFSTGIKKHRAKDFTVTDWANANPGMEYDELKWELCHGAHGLVEPERQYPRQSHLIILTTYKSFKKQFADHLGAVMLPRVDRFSIDCDKDKHCTASGSCKSNAHFHWNNALRSDALVVARFAGDECHKYKYFSSGYYSNLQDVISKLPDFRCASWGITGTPMSASPSDPLPVFSAQYTSAWAKNNRSKLYERSAVQALIRWDEYMARYRTSESDAPKGVLFEQLTGERRPGSDAEAAGVFVDAYDKSLVKFVKDWAQVFMIQLKHTDTWNKKMMLDLPPMAEITTKFSLKEKHAKVVERLIRDHCKKSAKLRALNEKLKRINNKTGTLSEIRKTKSVITDSYRYINTVNSFPALDDILEGRLNKIHAGKAKKNGWWSNPRQCFLYQHAHDLFESSPGAQKLLKDLLARDREHVVVEYDDLKLDRQRVEFDHLRKDIVAVAEPIVQFVLFLVLHSELTTRNIDPKKYLDCINAGSDTDDIVKRFQLEGDEKVPRPQPSLDLIIMGTRVGGVGITLNRARKMVFFDVDNLLARFQQTYARMLRLGQKNETTSEQYITETHGIDEQSLRIREGGHEVIVRLLDGLMGEKENQGGSVEDAGQSRQLA